MNIAVYCASSTKIHPDYFAAAEELGRLMAEQHITLINGAGKMGLMAATSTGCLNANGKVIGVIPQFMIDQNWHDTRVTELVVAESMHDRKQTIADISDGCIALPGGCGTLDELMEIITWKQLGIYLKPIVILNLRGYYDHLLAQLERGLEEHFLGEIHKHIWKVATTPAEALEMIKNTPLWDGSIRKFAAI